MLCMHAKEKIGLGSALDQMPYIDKKNRGGSLFANLF